MIPWKGLFQGIILSIPHNKASKARRSPVVMIVVRVTFDPVAKMNDTWRLPPIISLYKKSFPYQVHVIRHRYLYTFYSLGDCHHLPRIKKSFFFFHWTILIFYREVKNICIAI